MPTRMLSLSLLLFAATASAQDQPASNTRAPGYGSPPAEHVADPACSPAVVAHLRQQVAAQRNLIMLHKAQLAARPR